jgi:hypothetical protein
MQSAERLHAAFSVQMRAHGLVDGRRQAAVVVRSGITTFHQSSARGSTSPPAWQAGMHAMVEWSNRIAFF